MYVYMLYMMCMMCMMCNMYVYAYVYTYTYTYTYMYLYARIYLRHIAPPPMCAHPHAIVCVDVREYQFFPSIMWIMRMRSRGQD